MEQLFDVIGSTRSLDTPANALQWPFLTEGRPRGFIAVTGASRSGKTLALFELCRVCLPTKATGGENRVVFVVDMDEKWTAEAVIQYFVAANTTGVARDVLSEAIERNLFIVKSTFEQLPERLDLDYIVEVVGETHPDTVIPYILVDSFTTGLATYQKTHDLRTYLALTKRFAGKALKTQKILQSHVIFTCLYISYLGFPEDPSTVIDNSALSIMLSYLSPELAKTINTLVYLNRKSKLVTVWDNKGVSKHNYIINKAGISVFD